MLQTASPPIPAVATPAFGSTCGRGATPMARVDLYFGADRANATAWAAFLKQTVTPRFAQGFTSYAAHGQWRGRHGIVGEATRVLIIYYRPGPTRNAAIDAIRAAYKRRFRQDSVLRADSTACVSF